MEASQAVTDVTQAQAMGFDAFALNVISTESWCTDSISYLFQAAAAIGFMLFFSFDMINFSEPSQFIPLLQQYVGNSAYYKYNGLPFVSKLPHSIFITSRKSISPWASSCKRVLFDDLILTTTRYLLRRNAHIRRVFCE
jgi:hypothetical protein